MLAAAVTGALLALALLGPALLPADWPVWISLGLAGVLSLLLGLTLRSAGVGWGAGLLWLGWVLAAVQWAWAWAAQPAGLPYWLAGLALGGVGAALRRLKRPAPEARAAAAVVPETEGLLDSPTSVSSAPIGPPSETLSAEAAALPSWTAPLPTASAPRAPLQHWSIPMDPTPTAADRLATPAWAAPDPDVQTDAGAPRPPAEHSWTGQTWWEQTEEQAVGPGPSPASGKPPGGGPKPEPGVDWDGALWADSEWAEAEALLEGQLALDRVAQGVPTSPTPQARSTRAQAKRAWGQDVRDRD